MATVILKPKAGLTVRHPKTLKPLNKEGTRVEMSAYWQRRLRDGDVVVVRDQTTQSDADKAKADSNQKNDKTKSKGTRR
ncbi:DUF2635 domain-containing protein [Vibrio paucivorans]